MKKAPLFLLCVCCLISCLCLPVHAAENIGIIDGGLTSEIDNSALVSDITQNIGDAIIDSVNQAINGWVANLVNSLVSLVNEILIDMLDCVFHVENLVQGEGSTLLTAAMLRHLYSFLYMIACSLVILKFLLKGFGIYILGRGGDPDVSPKDMLIGIGQAAVMMVSFPYLYDKCVDIFLYIAQGIMGRLGTAQGTSSNWVWSSHIAGSSFLIIVLVLVFFVLAIILWIKLMSQGFELLIMRLGVPFATIGLIDSDMALWKNYVQVFFKIGFTIIIQVSLMSLAFRLIWTTAVQISLVRIIAAIAILITALSTPKLLQQFLIPQGAGGGFAQKAYSIAMVGRAAKMLFA